MTFRSLRTTLPSVALMAAFWGVATGCTTGTHPLDGDGTVEIVSDTDGPLFAQRSEAYLVGRQTPYEMNISLKMSRSGKPEHGAYVDVRITPPPALSLHETDGTCVPEEGAFRCVGNGEGYAHFMVRSDKDWSGTARIVVAWASTQAGLDVHVKPAGLPEGSTDFELLAGSSDNSDNARIRPSYPFTSLCTLGGEETSQWPSASHTIRNAMLTVRAIAPLDLPGVIENAPVLLSSDSTEGEFSTKPECTDRLTRIVVQLNATGESSPVYVCFSNVGGTMKISAKSGEITSGPIRGFVVDPEPRLLEIKPLVPIATLGTEADLWQVLAYGAANMEPIALEVDFKSIGVPMAFGKATAKLSTDTNAPTTVRVTPLQVGTAAVRVAPQFRADKACESSGIPVVEVPDAGGAD